MLKEEELTKRIIGLAMKIHRELGPGFKESVYHKSLIAVLRADKHVVEIEKPFIVKLKGVEVGKFRADLIVDSKVIVEVKSIIGRMPRFFHLQLISYLKASGLQVGLLLNFGNASLEIKRAVN